MARVETGGRHPRECLRRDIYTFKQSKPRNDRLQINEPGARNALREQKPLGAVRLESGSSEGEALRAAGSAEKGLAGPSRNSKQLM